MDEQGEKMKSEGELRKVFKKCNMDLCWLEKYKGNCNECPLWEIDACLDYLEALKWVLEDDTVDNVDIGLVEG
jgi:hypothetical protein